MTAAAGCPILAAAIRAAEDATAPPRVKGPRADLLDAVRIIGAVEVWRDLPTWNGWPGKRFAVRLTVLGCQVWASRAVRRGEARSCARRVFVHPDDVPTLRGALEGRRIARKAFGIPDPVTLDEFLLRPARLDRMYAKRRTTVFARMAYLPVISDPSAFRYVTGVSS